MSKYGPSLGPLYTDKTDAWEGAHHLHTSNSSGAALSDAAAATAGPASACEGGGEGAAAEGEGEGYDRRPFSPLTCEEQIARAIATTFCDDDEVALEGQLLRQQKKNL